MKFIKRLIYLLYYIRETDYKRMKRFKAYASARSGRSKMSISLDAFISVFAYNISIVDYYYFRFFEIGKSERRLWAGTGYMYEYQLKMNPRGAREILENKILFLNEFKSFFKRKHLGLKDLENDQEQTDALLSNSSGRLVLKNSLGQVGAQVEPVSCSDFNHQTLLEYMKQKDYDLVEE